MTTYKGITHFHSETGTEGGYWAFQDATFIHGSSDMVDGKCPWDPNSTWCPAADTDRPNPQHWSYDGLHTLKDGDHLTIFDNEDTDRVVWEGVIDLEKYPLFTEDAEGMWIHADQKGISRDTWASYFLTTHPAILEHADGQP